MLVTVHCPISHADVVCVTNLEGATLRVVCGEYDATAMNPDKPQTAEHSGMPGSARRTGAVDRILPLDAIAPALLEITGMAAAQGQPG